MLYQSPTVGIVDAQFVYRHGLHSFFNLSSVFQPVFEVSNCEELQLKLGNHPLPDVLLLELDTPVSAVYQTLSWLLQTHPTLPVIIITSHETELTMDKLYRLGVRAILRKCICGTELLKAVTRVYEEGYYYSTLESRKYIQQAQSGRSEKQSKPALSDKDELFLCFSRTDLTYIQIASEMATSERGIDKIRRILFGKLHVANRTSMAMMAAANCIGFLPDSKYSGGGEELTNELNKGFMRQRLQPLQALG